MSGRSGGSLVIAAILAATACSSSPTDPERAPTNEPGILRPAAHLDCDSAEDIRTRIEDLESDGTLNHGQATALRAKLDQAERHGDAGRPGQAAEAYARLIAQIEEWVADGVLTEEEAASLLACSEDVLDGPDVSFAVISAGFHHTCGIITQGNAYCWGQNDGLHGGQLGDGNAGVNSDTPVAVIGAFTFQTISAGGFHTCGLSTSGDAYCWGNNDLGQLGDGNYGIGNDTPVAVVGGLVFQSISTGRLHTCGVTIEEAAYCWGAGHYLGDGTAPTDSDIPVAVAGGYDFNSISTGDFHTCGLTTGGEAYCWGNNQHGQLGDGNAEVFSDTPVAVLGDLVFKAIGGGLDHTCGATTLGDTYCWGRNFHGQLGDGNMGTESDIPLAVVGGLVFDTISAGFFHTCGVTATGSASCWGGNDQGQLGDGNTPTGSGSPVGVVGGFAFENIDVGAFHTCGVTASGDGYCWGFNQNGELGDGNAGTGSDTPIAVAQP